MGFMRVEVECNEIEARTLLKQLVDECIEHTVERCYGVDEDGETYNDYWKIIFYYDGKLI